MSHYRLPEHCHFSVNGDHCIFLDLLQDRYFGLTPEQTRHFRLLVGGGDASSPAVTTLANELIERGLLTAQAHRSRPLSAITLPPPVGSLVDRDADDPPAITAWHVIAFGIAVTKATLLLRTRSFLSLISRAQHRRERHRRALSTADWERARSALDTFQWLCPWVYARRDRCYFDSVVVLEYLALFNIFPRWIIGVTSQPFCAHAWVQLDDFVLNDTPQHVRMFTPIVAS